MVLLCVFLLVVGLSTYNFFQLKTPGEIQKIIRSNNMQEKQAFYRKLIINVGPEKAQVLLKNSGIPANGDAHLLNHTVGEYLYAMKGNAGLVDCKDYFLASCYHGFVLKVIASENASENITQILSHCFAKSRMVGTQCVHAIGHGFLANENYVDLTKALAQCDSIAALQSYFYRLYCYNGVFMENVWALHGGQLSTNRWLKNEDPFFPCNDMRLTKDAYKAACWANQPSFLYELYEHNLVKVADICSQASDPWFISNCYDAIARKIPAIAGGDTKQILELCGEMQQQSWVDNCVAEVAESMYDGGEKKQSYGMCTKTREENKKSCYDGLLKEVAFMDPQLGPNRACQPVQEATWQTYCERSYEFYMNHWQKI